MAITITLHGFNDLGRSVTPIFLSMGHFPYRFSQPRSLGFSLEGGKSPWNEVAIFYVLKKNEGIYPVEA